MTIETEIANLPPNTLYIEEADRVASGMYQLDPGFIHIFPFEIVADGRWRVPFRHLNTNNALHQNFTIRGWISEEPNGIELFFRFPFLTGGSAYIFYDENTTMVPTPKTQPPMRSEFSGITYTVSDQLVPLPIGTYYFNVINMVLKTNAYELFFDPYEEC